MIAYIQQIAQEIVERTDFLPPRVEELEERLVVLREELDRLDPREFSPQTRFDFVTARREIRTLTRTGQSFWDHHSSVLQEMTRLTGGDPQQTLPIERAGEAIRTSPEEEKATFERNLAVREHAQGVFDHVKAKCNVVIAILSCYSGPVNNTPSRSLALVQNAGLRSIVERDYRELEQILYPEGAWKSVVIMAGSILEAILYDRLTRDTVTVKMAMAATEAPKKKGGVVKEITSDSLEDEWKLSHLIKVAVELRFLSEGRANTIHEVLREYRNFVHPKKELKKQHSCSDAEGMGALAALKGVIDHLK